MSNPEDMIYVSTGHFYELYHKAKQADEIQYKANCNESVFSIPYDVAEEGTRLVLKAIHKDGSFIDSCTDYLEYPDGSTEQIELNIESKVAMQKALDEWLENEGIIF